MRVFIDTSALVALYHPEPKTLQVEAYVKDSRIFISRLALVEFRSAAFRLVRKGTLKLHEARALVDAFRKDLGKYHIQEINLQVWAESVSLIEKHASKIDLRSLDAIQLAAAKMASQRNSIRDFVTLDVHGLAQAAEAEGFLRRP
jgi:predicted nucleic acid-binding protein